MKKPKKSKGKERDKKKILASLGVAFLILSSGVLPVSALKDQDVFQNNLIDNLDKIPTSNLLQALPSDFDYIDELNNIYSENFDKKTYVSGDYLKKALQDKDYDSYLEGFPEDVSVIDKRDFEILAELKKENLEIKSQEDKNEK